MQMKTITKNITLGFFIPVLLGALSACKSMVDSPEGTANIYLTAAINSVLTVPANPKNYVVYKEQKQLHVPVYIARSGLQPQAGFTVSIAADNVAAQKLIDKGTVDKTKAIVAPADVYSIPGSVAAENGSADFEAIFDASKLNAYLGKLLVLSVHISNASKFQINEKLSTLNIVLDIDAIMLGTKVEVTDKYIKNSGHPFIAAVYDGSRRGVLADWTTSASVKNYVNGTLGGYDNYGNGGFMSMERYSSPQIPNGKIYLSPNLAAGKYELTIAFLDHSIKDEAYLIAAPGATLPDIDKVAEAFAYAPFTTPKIEFVVPQTGQVSFGILANLIQDQQYFRLDKFRLYQYQNLFD